MNAVVGKIVGVDVGGTFTDLFYYDEDAAQFRTAKVPSNRGDEAIGFLEGLKSFGPLALGSVVHGTTVGTNALLERRSPHRPCHNPRLPRRARDAPARPAPDMGPLG